MPVIGYIRMDDVSFAHIGDDDEEYEDHTVKGKRSQNSDDSDESHPLSTNRNRERNSGKACQ